MNPGIAKKINTHVKKKESSAKKNNDREETHKMFLLRDCFGFILLFW